MKQSRGGPKSHEPASVPAGAQPEPAAIARRAYEIYLERGAQAGHDLDDWLRAEDELRRGRP